MFKVYYAGIDPDDCSNFTRFAVASMEFKTGEDSQTFKKEHPALLEIGIEVNGRKFELASGMVSVKF